MHILNTGKETIFGSYKHRKGWKKPKRTKKYQKDIEKDRKDTEKDQKDTEKDHSRRKLDVTWIQLSRDFQYLNVNIGCRLMSK